MKLFILLSMIFCHVVDDYYLQGILASMKQKSWWQLNAPDKMYCHDYIVALIMHAFSWAFMIMLPLAIYTKFVLDVKFMTLFVINWLCHAIMDDMKANKKMCNLIEDQAFHMMQIILTWNIF